MRSHNDLYAAIIAPCNLLDAFYAAVQGKHNNAVVAAFEFNLSKELLRLQHELATKTYQPGAYTTFYVLDPKKRMISASPFRDRVVHHALCNVTAPLFEKTFIHDTYANRKGKGTHKAIERYQHYARKYPYVLKCDIKKFFPSLDHAILKQEIRWKITCPDTLWLIDRIIDHSNEQEPHLAWFPGDDLFTPATRRHGLPIGNLTSQFWANVYLNRFDHFIKEYLRAPGYVRYVDDFVLFAHTRAELHRWRAALTEYLAGLRVLPHPHKTHIHRTAAGVPFLGFRVWPQYRAVQKEKARRFERHLRQWVSTSKRGAASSPVEPHSAVAERSDKISEVLQAAENGRAWSHRKYRSARQFKAHLEAGLNSWRGHVCFGQSRRLTHRVFWTVRRAGFNLVSHPAGGWRVL